jgi:hypothetical protein
LHPGGGNYQDRETNPGTRHWIGLESSIATVMKTAPDIRNLL